MASDLPLVAPNSGGILSYANESNAWLTEPNAVSFSAAIRDAVANEDLRRTRIENALATVEENRSEASAERLLDTYDRLYAKFLAKRAAFTGEHSNDASAALAKWVTFGMLGGLTYLFATLDC